MIVIRPTIKAPVRIPRSLRKNWNNSVRGITVPLIKFGTVVATVERRLVPNCSAAMVTNKAQYPIPNPSKKQIT